MPDVYIFDFDDTIIRSPRPRDASPTSSWWRDPASLKSPYIREDSAWSVALPRTYDRVIEVGSASGTVVVVLTGRPPHLTQEVADVLTWLELPVDVVMAVGSPIIDNKLAVIWQLLNQGEEVPYIEIWDDRADHLIAFRHAIKHWSPKTEVVTRHVQ